MNAAFGKLRSNQLEPAAGQSNSARKSSVGLDQRPDFDVGDFRGAGHLQRGHDHLGDVFGLQQKLGLVFPAFGLVERLHSGRRRAPEIHAQHANAVGIDFLPQTIGEGLECVLGCGEKDRWRLWPPILAKS